MKSEQGLLTVLDREFSLDKIADAPVHRDRPQER
jgi:hypothetical protein